MKWEIGIGRQYAATFTLTRQDIKLMVGDELLLKYDGEFHRPWQGIGHPVIVSVESISYHFLHYYRSITDEMIYYDRATNYVDIQLSRSRLSA